jgi:hypothetical protein
VRVTQTRHVQMPPLEPAAGRPTWPYTSIRAAVTGAPPSRIRTANCELSIWQGQAAKEGSRWCSAEQHSELLAHRQSQLTP